MNEEQIRKLVKESIEERFGDWAKEKAQKTWQSTKNVGKAIGREAKETVTAGKILLKFLRKQNPTPEEIKFLKGQSADLGKAAALIGLQVVPGSSAAIVALEKFLKKYDMTLFPKQQQALSEDEEDKIKVCDSCGFELGPDIMSGDEVLSICDECGAVESAKYIDPDEEYHN